jgi:hypothetical protein
VAVEEEADLHAVLMATVIVDIVAIRYVAILRVVVSKNLI